MSQHTFELTKGITSTNVENGNATTHKTILMREPTSGDIMDSRLESERLIETASGPTLLVSNELFGFVLLGRQIERIGDLEGPFTPKELRKLSGHDLLMCQQEAEKLDKASISKAIDEISARGRNAEDGGASGDHDSQAQSGNQ